MERLSKPANDNNPEHLRAIADIWNENMLGLRESVAALISQTNPGVKVPTNTLFENLSPEQQALVILCLNIEGSDI